MALSVICVICVRVPQCTELSVTKTQATASVMCYSFFF